MVTEDESPPDLRGGRIEVGNGTWAWARDSIVELALTLSVVRS